MKQLFPARGVILAPMAGVTDYAFREICAGLGACATVTEMVSAKALCYGDKKTASLLRRNAGVLCGAQIFGSEPEFMARGARLALELSGADYIDINMGCPMPKIVNNGEGSALMKDPALAGRIIRAVCDAVEVPVTVKTRKGWDKSHVNVVELARIAQDNGAAAIAVHGRTKTMLYSGTADWDVIAEVKRAVSIPVIANGDVWSADDCRRIVKYTGCEGVMLGRGTFGNPWLFAQCRAILQQQDVPELPPLARRMDTAVRQIELSASLRGERVACLEARRHMAWYLRGIPHSAWYRRQAVQLSTLEDVRRLAQDIRKELS